MGVWIVGGGQLLVRNQVLNLSYECLPGPGLWVQVGSKGYIINEAMTQLFGKDQYTDLHSSWRITENLQRSGYLFNNREATRH